MPAFWRELPLFAQLFIVFLAAMYVTMSILALWSRRPRNVVRERLDEVRRERAGEQAAAELPAEEDEESRRLAREAERRARRLIEEELARRTGFAGRMARKLRRADVRLRVSELLAFQVAGATVLAGIMFAATGRPVLAMLGALAGLWLPHAYLDYRYARRMRAFHDQLPDALTLMANALKSGYSFLQAADVVGREMPAPIGPEFSQVVRETRVNIALEDALANLLDRVESPDLDLVVTAVLVNAQVGGNLSQVLDSISSTIRQRIRLRGQVRTLTAQGRMSGLIIGLLPVGLGVLIGMIAPEFITLLFTHPLGWVMLGVAVVLETMGIVVIRRIVRVEV